MKLARPERLLAGCARSSLAQRARDRRRQGRQRPTRRANAPGCRTHSSNCREFESLPPSKCSTLSGVLVANDEIGAPGEIRTPDLMVRSHALYPTELRARRTQNRPIPPQARKFAYLEGSPQCTRQTGPIFGGRDLSIGCRCAKLGQGIWQVLGAGHAGRAPLRLAHEPLGHP
jgi:hypothetical protein